MNAKDEHPVVMIDHIAFKSFVGLGRVRPGIPSQIDPRLSTIVDNLSADNNTIWKIFKVIKLTP